jgi:hypothetical protein
MAMGVSFLSAELGPAAICDERGGLSIPPYPIEVITLVG